MSESPAKIISFRNTLLLGVIGCMCYQMVLLLQQNTVDTDVRDFIIDQPSSSINNTGILLEDQNNGAESIAASIPALPTTPLEIFLAKYNINGYPKKVQIPDANRSIAFLHIGKTAGSTISMHIRNGCHASQLSRCATQRKDGWIVNETVASYRIKAYYHLGGIPLENINDYTTIITAVRNPLTRFLSAFAYEHPENAQVTKLGAPIRDQKVKYSCFPTVSHLIKAGMGEAEIKFRKSYEQIRRERDRYRKKAPRDNKMRLPPAKIDCTALAQTIFGLKEDHQMENNDNKFLVENHMTFDYRQFYKSMPPTKELIVLRNSHLVKDWVSINNLLGAEDVKYRDWPEVPPFQEIHRNVSRSYTTKDRWRLRSRQEQLSLCHLLQEEIQTYLMILVRAINLNAADFDEAASEINEVCGNPPLHLSSGSAK